MAEDLITIGIALDTSQMLTGTRQVQDALRQVEAAEKSAQTATKALEQSSTQAAQALGQERTAASGAASSTQQLSQASGQAASGLKQASSAASQAAQALRQTEQATGGLKSALASVGTQAGAFALAQAGVQGLQQALSTAKATFEDLVRSGLQMAQLRGSFTAIAGGVGAGTREFQFAVKTANELGLEVRSVAEQYRSLSAATRGTALEGAATREILTTLARAAQAYGLSTEQLGRAQIALQQIIGKGKVTMEELRGQLAEAIPGAMQIAARAMGTTTAGLEELVAKGADGIDFTRRFIAQLGTEVPQAAARAGKGIAQLGNEILLLKDRIAQSGLIAFLDSASAKVATLLRQSREAEEKEAGRAERRAGRELGGGVTLDSMQAQDRQKLIDKTRELADAEKRLTELTKAREERKFGIFTPLEIPESALRAARQQVDTLREEERALKARLNFQTLERQEQEKRRQTYTQSFKEQQGQNEAVDSANKTLKTTLDAAKKSQDELNKSSALTPEIYGKQTGTLQEQLRFLEQRKKLTEASLKDVTEAIVARGAGVGAAPKELETQRSALQTQLREDNAAIERHKQTLADLEQTKRKAAQDAEEASRKKQQAQAEEKRLDDQQAEEVRRTHFQNFEALKRLEAQYTSVRAVRDEDRASTLAASLATSKYADEAQRAAANIEAVVKAEAKLPQLRSEAAQSAERLTTINRLMQQFEPRRRGESTEERLTRSYTELANAPGVTMGKLSEASEKMQEILDAEQWTVWRDTGMDALHDLTEEFAQMAFQGKLSFTDLGNHAVQQLFRIASEATFSRLFTQGGWLEQGLNLGLTALGLVGGGGTSGTLPTTWSQYNAGLAAGRYSGRQSGGDVLAGQPYWVGERGAELVIPRQTSTVLPHAQSMQLASPTINVIIQGVTNPNEWRPSEGAIKRGIAQAVQASYRAL